MAIVKTTDTDFDKDVLKSGKLAVVHFWAKWSWQSRDIADWLKDMDRDLDEKVQVVTFDTDLYEVTPKKYDVRSIPTLMLFKNGAPIDFRTRLMMMDKGQVDTWVQRYL